MAPGCLSRRLGSLLDKMGMLRNLVLRPAINKGGEDSWVPVCEVKVLKIVLKVCQTMRTVLGNTETEGVEKSLRNLCSTISGRTLRYGIEINPCYHEIL